MYCGGTRADEQICQGMREHVVKDNALKQLEVSYYLLPKRAGGGVVYRGGLQICDGLAEWLGTSLQN